MTKAQPLPKPSNVLTLLDDWKASVTRPTTPGFGTPEVPLSPRSP